MTGCTPRLSRCCWKKDGLSGMGSPIIWGRFHGECCAPCPSDFLLQRLEFFDVGSCTDATKDLRSLKTLLQDEVSLNMAISELYRIFLAKRKQNSGGGLISISLHDSICRWRFATIGDSRVEWIMQASYGLTRHVRSCCDW